MPKICRSCCGCTCTVNLPSGYSGCAVATSIPLTGIASPSGGTISIAATSSNTAILANPTVTYTSPNTTGSLNLAAGPGGGTATITFTVSSTACSPVTKTFNAGLSASARPPTLANPGNVSSPLFLLTVNLTGITPSVDVPLSGASGGCSTSPTGSLSIIASSSNPGVAPNPPVTYTSPNTTGSLAISRVAAGSTTIFVTVSQSNIVPGGSGCCIYQSSISFTVTFV